MKRSQKRVVLYFIDLFMIYMSHVFAYQFLLAYSNRLSGSEFYVSLFVTIFVYTLFGIRFRIFSIINRFTDYKIIFAIIMSLLFAAVAAYGTSLFYFDTFSRRFIFLTYLFSTFLVVLPRMSWRMWHDLNPRYRQKKEKQRKKSLGSRSWRRW